MTTPLTTRQIIRELRKSMRDEEIAVGVGCDARSVDRWFNNDSAPLPVFRTKLEELYETLNGE